MVNHHTKMEVTGYQKTEKEEYDKGKIAMPA